MQKLIERLEKATGPDRVIDLAISVEVDYRSVFAPHADWKWSPMADELRSVSGGLLDPTQFVPRWTASLDAARTLTAGFYWIASEGKTRDSEPLGGARVFRRDYLVKPIAEAEHEHVQIALCIAALKARAAIIADHRDGGA